MYKREGAFRLRVMIDRESGNNLQGFSGWGKLKLIRQRWMKIFVKTEEPDTVTHLCHSPIIRAKTMSHPT